MLEKIIYIRRLGDNALILSQRLSEWCGKGPALEEDMALTNVALDLIGQARLWLDYSAELIGGDCCADKLAFHRDEADFNNFLLVEQPNGNYGNTLVRQFFFDTWHYFQLKELRNSSDKRIADIAEKSLKEVTYHLRRSGDLIIRLGDGTEYSHQVIQNSINHLWMYTGEMFQSDAIDTLMEQSGVTTGLEKIRDLWLTHIKEIVGEATLNLPNMDAWMQKGGKQGRHTEHLGYILAEMQFLQRAYPGVEW